MIDKYLKANYVCMKSSILIKWSAIHGYNNFLSMPASLWKILNIGSDINSVEVLSAMYTLVLCHQYFDASEYFFNTFDRYTQ